MTPVANLEPITYFVTDVELDGLDPSRHSMISLATVAMTSERGIVDQFTINLKPRADRVSDPRVMSWWMTQPLAYAASTKDPVAPEKALATYVEWIESFDGVRAFASRPLLLDGAWMDEYLRTFVECPLVCPPWAPRKIFHGSGIDIGSYIEGLFGWRYIDGFKDDFPAEWLGDVEHTHAAIDDALGYANLLLRAVRISAAQPKKVEDFRKRPS